MGLLLEAFGACTYCIGNIHRSKTTRRKQTSNNYVAALETGRDNPFGQQDVRTITHILSNRTLNQTAINSSQNSINDPQIDDIPLNDPNIQDQSSLETRINSHSIDMSNLDNSDNNHQTPSDMELATSNAVSLEPINEESGQQQQLPKTQLSCLDIPDPSNSTSSDSNLARHDNNHIIVDPTLTRSSSSRNRNTSNDGPVQANNPMQVEESTGIDQTDLIKLQNQSPSNDNDNVPSSITNQRPTRERKESTDNRAHRAALRRTLVMGLSGEEEVIEINEEDLDNMSVLPPSYESIATDK